MPRRLVSVDDSFNLPASVKAVDANLPARLQDAALSATILAQTTPLIGASISDAAGNVGATRSGLASAKVRGCLAVRDTRPFVFVTAGSSTTFGTSASSLDKSMVHLLAKGFRAAYPLANGSASPVTRTLAEAVAAAPLAPGVNFVNAGIGGTQAWNYLTSTTIAQIAALNPSVVQHMVGSNDFANQVSLTKYKSDVLEALTALKAAITVPCVHYLVHSFERYDGAAKTIPWSEYGRMLKEIADADPDNVVFIDISAAYKQIGIPSTDPLGMMHSDKIHMVDSGHAFMADLLLENMGVAPRYASLTPARVTGLSATGRAGGLDATWSSVPDATSYQVEYRTGTGAWTTATVYTNSTSISGLTSGSLYEVQVSAKNGTTVGPASASATATPTAVTVIASDGFSGANVTGIDTRALDLAAGGSAVSWQANGSTASNCFRVNGSGKLVRGSQSGAAFAGFTVLPADVEVSITASTLTAGGVTYLNARRDDYTGTTVSEYRLAITPTTVQLAKRVESTSVTLIGSTYSYSAGDKLGIRAVGSTIRLMINNVAVSTITDATVTAGGMAGITTDSASTGWAFDDMLVLAA